MRTQTHTYCSLGWSCSIVLELYIHTNIFALQSPFGVVLWGIFSKHVHNIINKKKRVREIPPLYYIDIHTAHLFKYSKENVMKNWGCLNIYERCVCASYDYMRNILTNVFCLFTRNKYEYYCTTSISIIPCYNVCVCSFRASVFFEIFLLKNGIRTNQPI